MENNVTAPLAMVENISLSRQSSISMCGQLGVKKNFLQRACGTNWTLDKARQNSDDDEMNTVPLNEVSNSKVVTKIQTKSKVPVATRQLQGSSFLPKNENSSPEKLEVMSYSVSVERSCKDLSSLHSNRMSNSREPKTWDGAPNGSQRQTIMCTTVKSVLTPQKNRSNIDKNVSRSPQHFTPTTNKLGNFPNSDSKRFDNSRPSFKGYSVKRQIFSHDDKENRPPPSQEDLSDNFVRQSEILESTSSKASRLIPSTPPKTQNSKNVEKSPSKNTLFCKQEFSSSQIKAMLSAPPSCRQDPPSSKSQRGQDTESCKKAVVKDTLTKSNTDCLTTPSYKRSVVTAKQMSESVQPKIEPPPPPQDIADSKLSQHTTCSNNDHVIAETGDNGGVKLIPIVTPKDILPGHLSPSLDSTTTADKDPSSSHQDSGFSETKPDSSTLETITENPERVPRMAHLPYAPVYSASPVNYPLPSAFQHFHAGGRVPITATATSGSSPSPSLAFGFSPNPVMYSPSPSPSPYMSPYLGHMLNPMFASTPNPSSTMADVERWHQHMLFLDLVKKSPHPMTMPSAHHPHPGFPLTHQTEPCPSAFGLKIPVTMTRAAHQPERKNEKHYNKSRKESDDSSEQRSPMDLSGMSFKSEDEDVMHHCRKTLFPRNWPHEAVVFRPPSNDVMTRFLGDGFNSSGETASKSDISGQESPESQRPGTSGVGHQMRMNAEQKEEKNPFGIHKILGVEKSPVKWNQPQQRNVADIEAYSDRVRVLQLQGEAAPSPQSQPIPQAKPNAAVRSTKRRLPLSAEPATQQPLKKRDKPPPWGEAMADTPVLYDECEERTRFCEPTTHRFQVPEVPRTTRDQEELREALLRLYKKSNLPPVPESLRDNLISLRFFPHMKTLVQAAQFVDTEKLRLSPGGFAFENFRTQESNEAVDQMLYKDGTGSEAVFFCLGRKCIDVPGSKCGFMAKSLGKMRRHVKNHMAQKKWVCCFCRTQMTDQTDISRHATTHTMLRPFTCKECGKFFTQKVTLTNHMLSNHSIQLEEDNTKDRFTCRQCGVHFNSTQRQECITHLKTYHLKNMYVSLHKKRKFPFNEED